jgi:hypothetical protein
MAIYTESLFLLAAIGAFYFARRGIGSWPPAGHCAGIDPVDGPDCRPYAAAGMAAAVAVDGREERPFLSASSRFHPVNWVGRVYVLSASASLATRWPLCMEPSLGARAPIAVVTIAELLQRPAEGWGTAVLAGHLHVDNWIDFCMVLLFWLLGSVLLVNRRWSEAAFVLLGTLMPFSSGLLMSQRRYVWVLFPAFILLAQWGKRPWLDKTITALFLLGLGLFIALFVNGYWVG